MSIFSKIKVDYNQTLDTLVKYNNNVIGADVREKIHDACDYISNWAITGGSMSANYDWAYKGRYCIKAVIGAGNTAELSRSFTDAINIIEFASSVNNFATVHDTGRFATMSSLLLKFMSFGDCRVKMRVYNGTKYAEFRNWEIINNAADKRFKSWLSIIRTIVYTQWDDFLGFDQGVDFENITKISVLINNSSGSDLSAFIQEIKTIDNAFSDSETTDIYVSKVFGSDSNSGLRKDLPVRTIQRGIDLATAGNYKVKILDSETYKENLTINRAFLVELSPTLGEKPIVKGDSGVISRDGLGARKDYRRKFYRGTGTKYYVAKSGNDGNAGTDSASPKLTIMNAVASCVAGDCVEILDNGVYDEVFSFDNISITIQSAPQYTATLKDSAGIISVEIYNHSGATKTMSFYGVIFESAAVGATSTTSMISVGERLNDMTEIIDCTFSNMSFQVAGMYYINALSDGNLHVENCLFTEICGGFQFYIRLANSGTKHVENCFAYVDNQGVFVAYVGSSAGKVLSMNIIACEVEFRRDYASPLMYLYMFNPATQFYGTITLTIKFCKNGRIQDVQNAAAFTSYILFNEIQGITNSQYESYYTAGSTYAYYHANRISASNVPSWVANYGISCVGAAATKGNLSIVNNVVTDFIEDGISVNDIHANTSIKNNVIINAKRGIYYGGIAAATNLVENNIITDCDKGVDSTNALTVSRCQLYNNVADVYGSASLSNSITAVDPDIYSIDDEKFFTDPKAFGRDYGTLYKDIGLYELDNGSLIISTTRSNIYYMRICGSSILNGVYLPVATSLMSYNNIYNCREGVRLPNGSSSSTYGVKSNKFTDNGIAVMIKDWTRVEKNLIFDNVFGIAAKDSEIYHNTISDNATGLVELYISNDIKNNIIYANTLKDYDGNAATDFNIIGSRENDETIGVNDINKDPLFIDSEYHVASIYIGYDLTSPAFRTATDSKDMGAQIDCLIRATLEKSTYTFNDNPINLTEYDVPLFLTESDMFNGDMNQDVQSYVKELLLSWDDTARIDATMKAALLSIFESAWVITLYFDGTTPEYFKVKKQNQFSIKRFKYIHDELPFGGVSLLVREIPNFDLTDFERADF